VPEKTSVRETEKYNSRFLSAQADAFTGSERGREGRPAPFGMTVAGRCESTVRNVNIRTLEKREGAVSKSAYTSSASGWMSSLPFVFLAIR
jgi:hypothetical protein